MDLNSVIKELEKKGRHGDNVLVHMSIDELEELKKRGINPTTNPHTGLNELFSLGGLFNSSIFKALLPIGLGFLAGPIGAAIAPTLGVSSAIGTGIAGAGLGAIGAGATGGNPWTGAVTGGLGGYAGAGGFGDTGLGSLFTNAAGSVSPLSGNMGFNDIMSAGSGIAPPDLAQQLGGGFSGSIGNTGINPADLSSVGASSAASATPYFTPPTFGIPVGDNLSFGNVGGVASASGVPANFSTAGQYAPQTGAVANGEQGWVQKLMGSVGGGNMNGGNSQLSNIFRAGAGAFGGMNTGDLADQTRSLGAMYASQADPFASQRPGYQQMLADSYADPYRDPAIAAQRNLIMSGVNRAGAKSGNPIHARMQAESQLAQIVQARQNQLGQLAGAQFNPASAGQIGMDANTRANALSQSSAAQYGGALGTLFGEKPPQGLTYEQYLALSKLGRTA